jgi:hypothetical protein
MVESDPFAVGPWCWLLARASRYRKAIALQPDDAKAHYNLGLALVEQKKLAEAEAAFRKADQLLPNHPLIRNNLRQAQRWLELDRQLPALLDGTAKLAGPQEQIELALFCLSHKEHTHAAARFFADAFRADPRLADDLQAQRRYNAACAAALAAAGKGKDAGKLDVQEQGRLRQQAGSAPTWPPALVLPRKRSRKPGRHCNSG